MAVLRRIRDQLGADDAAGPGTVLDDDLPAEPLGQVRGDHAADKVVETARRERNDDPHRLGRKFLRGRWSRQRERETRDSEQTSVQSGHAVAPL